VTPNYESTRSLFTINFEIRCEKYWRTYNIAVNICCLTCLSDLVFLIFLI
jgi:hypothetical protein